MSSATNGYGTSEISTCSYQSIIHEQLHTTATSPIPAMKRRQQRSAVSPLRFSLLRDHCGSMD